MSSSKTTIYTIGHSTHPYDNFLSLLKNVGVTALSDVRTSPFSRHNSQFNKDNLSNELRQSGINYVFLGKELGGRPHKANYYQDGVADYERMASDKDFEAGLNRLIEGSKKYTIALMCSEANPLDCHRCLLVGRALRERHVNVSHILASGDILSHEEIEDELIRMLTSQPMDDLLEPREERLSTAYRVRGRKVAYAEPNYDAIALEAE